MSVDPVRVLNQEPSEAEAVDAGTLARCYAARVHRFAAMVCRDDADAADLAQESLVTAIRRLSSYRPQRGTLDAWLWRIVVNTARDAGRATRRRALIWQRLLSEASAGAPASPEDEVLKRLADSELLELVRRLPKRDRTVIALRFGAQLTTAETAAELRTTPAAVVMATRRALERLRRSLEEKR